MITRPLDLGARLRQEPRNFDWLFLVNAGLIVLSFSLLGSRFVLAPGLGVGFRIPVLAGANSSAGATTHYISVTTASGLIFADEGAITFTRLGEWLREQAKITKDPALLVRASAEVSSEAQAKIVGLANVAGFRVIWAAEDSASRAGGGGR